MLAVLLPLSEQRCGSMPTVPVRSTGASDAIGRLEPVVQALAASTFVADCTVEGLQHAPELPAILKDCVAEPSSPRFVQGS